MTQHTQQQVAGLLDLRGKKSDRFCKRLIYRLIEANHIVQVWCARLALIDPQAQHAGTQSPIFGR
ncbi:hypothetical protein BCEP4_30032 [Burkholderia cepacia]|nr:hypothetical protein BCEP4_30032 [Burkholderia cepacia]